MLKQSVGKAREAKTQPSEEVPPTSPERERRGHVGPTLGSHELEGFAINVLHKYLLTAGFTSLRCPRRESTQTPGRGAVGSGALAAMLRRKRVSRPGAPRLEQDGVRQPLVAPCFLSTGIPQTRAMCSLAEKSRFQVAVPELAVPSPRGGTQALDGTKGNHR